MRRWTRSLPALVTILCAAVAAALPWGLPPELRLVPPLLPFLVMHFWIMRDYGLVPETLAFAAGLLLDVLGGGPLGYWALIYLAGYALSLGAASLAFASRALVHWLLLGLMLAVLGLGEVLVAAVYFNTAPDWSPPLFAAAAATLLYPLVAAAMRAIAGPGTGPGAATTTWSRSA